MQDELPMLSRFVNDQTERSQALTNMRDGVQPYFAMGGVNVMWLCQLRTYLLNKSDVK